MGFESVNARLSAMRGNFVPEEELESISAGRDARSIAMLLERSVFGPGMDNRAEVTAEKLLDAVDAGVAYVRRKTAEIVRRDIPSHFDLIFSRLEMEQIKEAVRRIILRKSGHEAGPSFCHFSISPGWIEERESCGGMDDFKKLLKRVRHPFAEGLNPGIGGSAWETELERYYFGKYLNEKKHLAGAAWEYFADIHDMVNLHTVCATEGGDSGFVEERYVPGPGRINKAKFSKLCSVSGAEFQSTAAKMTRLNIKHRRGNAGFAQSLRRELSVKWRVMAISNPGEVLAPLLFLEELSDMSANLKLAVNLGVIGATDPDYSNYFVYRRMV